MLTACKRIELDFNKCPMKFAWHASLAHLHLFVAPPPSCVLSVGVASLTPRWLRYLTQLSAIHCLLGACCVVYRINIVY